MNHGIITEDVAEAFPPDPFAFRGLDSPEPKWPRGFCAARHEWRLARASALRERAFYEHIAGPYADDAECYFIGFVDEDGGGLVKIGYSTCVGRRLGQLRSTSGPFKLHLLAKCRGGRTAEMHYHRKFAKHRFSGEWFELHPDILAEIARLQDSGRRAAA